MFAGRKRELGYLEKRYIQANAELLVIYGRRKIGKTELLKHFTGMKAMRDIKMIRAMKEGTAMQSIKNKQVKPVHLICKLHTDWLDKASIDALCKYGEALEGGILLRELLVPSDITLHALHYALQRAFGWQNSHLRSFELPKTVFDTLTQGTVKGWSDLVGVWFQAPSNFEGALFWDDNYEAGSIKKWLKEKYTGPYVNGGYYDKKGTAQKDVRSMLDRFPDVRVLESFESFANRKNKQNQKEEIKVLKVAPLVDLTLEEMLNSLTVDTQVEYLMESLRVTEVFDQLSSVIHYNYDFGDDWKVTIERADTGRAAELLRSKLVKQSELDAAEAVVIGEHRPVYIYRRGLNVLDDVGGLSGFASFLETVCSGDRHDEIEDDVDEDDEHEDDEDSAENLLTWAKSLGWSPRKISAKATL